MHDVKLGLGKRRLCLCCQLLSSIESLVALCV